ncbi:MAG: hypothetical protein AAGA75_13890 [Cyanobacteria bacterium P01_E01_bin.6]
MQTTIESMFDNAENRYLELEELNILTTYVESLPERIDAYRCLRDQEVTIMQKVADQLETNFSTESQQTLERCLKNALLVMRYAAMAMLRNDAESLDRQLMGWLTETNAVYNTQTIDTVLYQLLNQQLGSILTQAQLTLFRPHLAIAEKAIVEPNKTTVVA